MKHRLEYYLFSQFPLPSQQYLTPFLVKQLWADAGKTDTIISNDTKVNAILGKAFLTEAKKVEFIERFSDTK